ncbi:glycosyltransferase family 2 protein [Actinoplanes sp. NPDC049265]|uniref:glycosyltransferase family 2 protein n=1 Tax=Actinoplanes sp. NPDC049265 TaxID=3363902 RepID=UPI00371252C7
MLGPPDVSVVLAVHDVMPYLTECLDSLAAQTIGPARMEIVAIDDGSTDGSGAELDRFAQRFAGRMTVVHQPNSGGPAQPFNRGLEASTGRYVFFAGADDRLGPEALERMVTAADEWSSDVLLGKVVGVNSRHIFQDIFVRDQADLDLFDSPLPRSLANTKLFRRSLLDEHGIRYREDMRIGSDFPFTLAACFHARRVSVLSGYDFYYAVRRFSGSNVTYQSRHALRVQTAEKIVGYVAELLPAGKKRDALMVRRFDHELARLLEDDVLGLDRATQQMVHDAIGSIAADHLTDEIAARLAPETRIRLAVARDGDLDDLLAVIGQDARHGLPKTVERGGRRYASYPGFGRLPDADFDVTSTPDWDAKLDVTAAVWHRDQLILTATGNGAADLSAGAEDIEARVTRAGQRVEITFDLPAVIAASDPTGQRRILSAQVGAYDPMKAPGRFNATGASGGAAVRAPELERPRPRVVLTGRRASVVALVTDASGRLMLSVIPVNARQITARLTKR